MAHLRDTHARPRRAVSVAGADAQPCGARVHPVILGARGPRDERARRWERAVEPVLSGSLLGHIIVERLMEQLVGAAELVAHLEEHDLRWFHAYADESPDLTPLQLRELYTKLHRLRYPHLTCVSLSPGFIQTNMTKGFGAKLTPEQGCVSSLHALFGDVTSGWYYGSDAKRSPLTCCRDPGTPEYEGEENPDPARYNN